MTKLRSTDWKSRTFQTPPPSAFYSFTAADENLSMSAVATYSEYAETVCSENAEWIYPEQQIARILVDLFKQVPQVESICASFGVDEITIWTLLESYDREARGRVYGKELEVCRLLGLYDFDFRVTSIELVSPDELTSTGSREIYRRP